MSIYQDYGMGSSAGSTSLGLGVGLFQGFFTAIMIFIVLLSIISIILMIAQWKIFSKAGRKGWYAFIPILNMWTFLEICGLSGWLSLIPGVNVIVNYFAYYKLAIKFGKSSGFAICTVLFPMVCLSIIAFDKSVYGEINNMVGNSINNNQAYQYAPTAQPYQPSMEPMPFVPQQQMVNNGMAQPNIGIQPQMPVDNQFNNQPMSQPIQQPAKVCPTCHNLNVSTSLFCEKCGTKL